MEKIREVITYREYFDDFFKEQAPKVKDKIIKVLDIVEQIDKAVHIMAEYYEEKEKEKKR